MNTLLLWDIDGTLTLSGGAGGRALVIALRDAFGLERALDGIDFAGRTDPWIMRQILARAELSDSATNISLLTEAYLAALPAALHNPHNRVLPGVRPALDSLAARGDVALALLTGNLQRGAHIKLGHHRLAHYFAFGAFADDSESRNDLGPVALRRAHAHHGVEFAPDRVFIIGDTPRDIECGKVIGARTIAVATGEYTAAALRVHAPTVLFEDLTDTAALLAAFA